MFISPQSEGAAEARRLWMKTKDADLAMIHMPTRMVAERGVLSGLKRNPRNLVQALGFIPRTMRLMYVHSYQSFLWNHAASHRIKTYGSTRVVAGDLVLCSPSAAAATTAAASNAVGIAAAVTSAGGGAEGGGMRGTDAEAEAEEAAAVAVEARAEGAEVRVVRQEEADQGIYSIDQVVLPLPGGSIQYPTNSTAEVFHSLAAKDGIDLFRSKHSVKEYSIERIPGGYRRLLQMPSDYNWRVLAYSRPAQVLAETDLDRLAASALSAPHATAPPAPHPAPSPASAPDPAALAAPTSTSAPAPASGAPAAETAAAAAAAAGGGTANGDAPVVMEAAHVYYGFKQPGYKGMLKQVLRGEGKAGAAADAAAEEESGGEAATAAGGDGAGAAGAAGAVPAVVVLASSGGVRLGKEELERLGIGEEPIGGPVGGMEGSAVGDGAVETCEGKEEGSEGGGGKVGAGGRGAGGAEGEGSEGMRVALQVEFTLPASGYATMAIRELLKASTAAGAHKSFNERTESRA
ncbi:hypothetical protein CLOP_g21844 [Closterium sp. NIES-67]|nr:hypothetical protein CLOP_g21844 [Closterium sp. NIES-67]